MCNFTTTLYIFSTLVQLLQFNSLRTLHFHYVRRRTCLNQTRSSVLSVHLSFYVTRLPNCACYSISASNSPFFAASRTLASKSATLDLIASSIAFLPLANSKGLLPQRTTRFIFPSTLAVHQRLTRLATSSLRWLPCSSVIHLCCVGVQSLFAESWICSSIFAISLRRRNAIGLLF